LIIFKLFVSYGLYDISNVKIAQLKNLSAQQLLSLADGARDTAVGIFVGILIAILLREIINPVLISISIGFTLIMWYINLYIIETVQKEEKI